MGAGSTTSKIAVAALALCLVACTQTRLTETEQYYAAFADAAGAMETIDSGVTSEIAGRDRAFWADQYNAARPLLEHALAQPLALESVADQRSITSMRAYLAYREDSADADSFACTDAEKPDLPAAALSAALYECFDSVGQALPFEGEISDRLSLFGVQEEAIEPNRRRAAFMTLSPLWRALNADNGSDSPYRRLVRAKQDDMRTAIADAERSLGIGDGESEQWLLAALEAWRGANPGAAVEPWDFDFGNGGATRRLAECASDADAARAANARFFSDLGAPISSLNVIEDVGVRDGMSPVDFTDFVTAGRWESGVWRPALLRVSVMLDSGGLGASAELAHEYGHVAHAAAMRTRAPLLWPDDTTMLVEAIADAPAWSVYTPLWQQKYLGCAASQAEGLRARLGPAMLDIAWGLFELRLAHAPTLDPNAVWTQITRDYLNIVPHPELSWWAVRGQLVESPGYMINYALGSFVTADIRARTAARIGDFDAGNARWYGELSDGLFQFGGALPPADLLRRYLGAEVSPAGLLSDIRTLGVASQ